MVTRLSHYFLRTLREDPADAEVTSHRLLVRAGYITGTVVTIDGGISARGSVI